MTKQDVPSVQLTDLSTENKSAPTGQALRQQAQEIAQGHVARLPETALSLEETQRLLHELRVSQIDIDERKRGETALQQRMEELSERVKELSKSETRLQQALKLLGAVTEGTETIIAAIDMQFCYTYFNEAYQKEIERLSGKVIQIGTSMIEAFASLPEQQKIVLTEWGQVLRGESTRKVLEFGDPHHYSKIYNVLHTPIRDADGNLIGAGEVAYDVTEKTRIEQALRESEGRYRSLFNGMIEGFALHEIVCDEKAMPCDYRFLDVNPAFEQLTNLSREDVAGKLKSEIAPLRGDDPKWIEIYGKVALTGEPIEFENYSPALKKHYEVFAYRPAPGQFATVFVDISERKQRENTLRRLNRTLTALSNINQAMMRAQNESDYIQKVCQIIVEDCGHAMVWIGFAEPDEAKTIRPVALAGFEKRYLEDVSISWADAEAGHGPTGTAIRTGEVSICNDILTNPLYVPWRGEAIKRGYVSSIALPLMANGKAFGALNIYSKDPDPFSEDEIKLLSELSSDLAYGITTLRMRTARAEAEEALRESETRFRLALKNAPVTVAAQDHDLHFLWAYNQRTVDPYTVIGKTDADIFPPEDAAHLMALKRKALETETECHDTLWVNSGGQRVYLDLFLEPLRDESGQVTGIGIATVDRTQMKLTEEALLQARDELESRVQQRTQELFDANQQLQNEVAERMQAEQALEEDRQRLLVLSQAERKQHLFSESLARATLLLNSSLDLNTVFDRILEQIHLVIPYHAAMITLMEEKMLSVAHYHSFGKNTHPEEVIPGSVPLDAFPILKIALASHKAVYTTDTRIEPSSADIPGLEWVRSYLVAPLQTGECVVGFLSLFGDQPGFFDQDAADHLIAFASQAALAIQNARLYKDLANALVQEQTMRSQLIQTEKFAAMGRMLASITHELNNPLQTIKNCLFLSRADIAPGSEISEYLEMAASEATRLANLVAQLREVYRPRQVEQAQPVQVLDLIANVRKLLGVHLQEKKVRWIQDSQCLENAPNLVIRAVADQIKQVFLNICMNAIEAMQPAGGQIQVDLLWADDGREVAVSFKDTGPGIPAEEIPRLFEPFYTTKTKGLGLGLSICYDIVERHGGRIVAESQLGQGATFAVWLPLMSQDDAR